MKFQELKSDEGFDVLLEIMAEVEVITSDPQYQEYIENGRKKNKAIGDNTFARLLYKDHRETTYRIIALANQTDAETVKAQDYPVTMKQIREILQDAEIASFFV